LFEFLIATLFHFHVVRYVLAMEGDVFVAPHQQLQLIM
jgi:hypothetical protein